MLSNTCFEAPRQLIYSVLQFAFVICLQSHSNARHQENTYNFRTSLFCTKKNIQFAEKSGGPGPQKRRACKNRLKEKNALSHILRSKITFARTYIQPEAGKAILDILTLKPSQTKCTCEVNCWDVVCETGRSIWWGNSDDY